MKLDPDWIAVLRAALATACPSATLALDEVELYAGPSPDATVPALQATVRTGGKLPALGPLHERLEQAFPGCFDAIAESGDEEASPAAIAAAIGRLACGLLRETLQLDIDAGLAWKKGRRAALWIEAFEPEVCLDAFRTALVAVGSALTDRDPAAATEGPRARLTMSSDRARPNFESGILIAAAQRRSIPSFRLGRDHAIWQFGCGNRGEQLWVTSSNRDGLPAARLSRNKQFGKLLIAGLGLPTPAWQVISADDPLEPAVKAVGWPCVAKPLSWGSGKGVSANLRNMAELEQAVAVARQFEPFTLIEAHQQGDDYRLMVIGGRLVAAVRREPASVVGDGKTTVAQLMAELNRTRERPERETGYLSPVPDDDALTATLATQGMARETIVPRGERVLLRTNANRSTGGHAIDVLNEVHPQIRQMAEQAAAAFGFHATGLDYVTPDISRSHEEVGGGILEVNTTPGMRVLLAAGTTEDELGALFLGERPARIPVSLVLAAPTDVQRLAASLADRLPPDTGLATAEGARIGPIALPRTELDSISRFWALLLNPAVHRAIVAWDHEQLVNFGLPTDVIDRVLIIGQPPPKAWLAALHRHSPAVIRLERAEQAIEPVLEPECAVDDA
jgi:cyanophycin synthetase